jgi:hypothetical protein
MPHASLALLLSLLAVGRAAGATDNPPTATSGCPLHDAHMHAAAPATTAPAAATPSTATAVQERGDQAMGFDHARTTHHFLLEPSGGIIQVEANAATDVQSRDQIRAHLEQVAVLFAAGDFSLPRQIHDRVLPGVTEMVQRKAEIRYQYEPLARGGRIRIEASEPSAVAAIHAFLGAQIADHATGDPLPAPGH